MVLTTGSALPLWDESTHSMTFGCFIIEWNSISFKASFWSSGPWQTIFLRAYFLCVRAFSTSETVLKPLQWEENQRVPGLFSSGHSGQRTVYRSLHSLLLPAGKVRKGMTFISYPSPRCSRTVYLLPLTVIVSLAHMQPIFIIKLKPRLFIFGDTYYCCTAVNVTWKWNWNWQRINLTMTWSLEWLERRHVRRTVKWTSLVSRTVGLRSRTGRSRSRTMRIVKG